MAKSNSTDKAPLKTVEDAWERASKVQTARNDIYLRSWQRYKGYNPNTTDPYRSNIVMPKLYSTVETIVPRLSKALFGRRPYIPIESETSPDMAEIVDLTLDHYLYKDKFKMKATQALKMMSVFGTAFLEPYPDVEMVTKRQIMDNPNYPWDQRPVEIEIPRFVLKIRQWAPWQVYVEPNMLDLDSPGYVITIEEVSKKEVQRLIDDGRYEKVDLNKSIDDGASDDGKNFAKKMISALGISLPATDSDYGILMRYMSKERYITVWNGLEVLEDRDNPYKHGGINLVRFIYNQDPMLQNSFWGQGEGKVLELLCDKLDETWNLTFDNHDATINAVYGFKENAVDAEDIVNIGGARIPIKQNFQGNIKEAIDRFDIQGLPADAYQVPAVLDNWIDRASGVFDMNRGENNPDDTKTATEASLLSTQGDLRSELRTEILENLALTDLADKATSHINQFVAVDDLLEAIGPEKVMMLQMMGGTLNPYDIPGGFDYQFRGSDSVVNDFQKRADWKQSMEFIKQSPYLRPAGAERRTLQIHGESDQEIDEIILTDEEIMQQAQQQAEMAEMESQKALENDFQRSQLGLGPGGNTKPRAVGTPTAGQPNG